MSYEICQPPCHACHMYNVMSYPHSQAVRNMDDLETMACPLKYRSLATFHKYYSGEAKVINPRNAQANFLVIDIEFTWIWHCHVQAPFPTLFSE